MVRRLVKQDYVRIAQKQTGKRKACFLPAAQRRNRLVPQSLGQRELFQYPPAPPAEFIPAARGKTLLTVGIPLCIGFRAGLLGYRTEIFKLLFRLKKVGKSVYGLVKNRARRIVFDILFKNADGLSLRDKNLSGGRLIFPGDHRKKRRFSGTVHADDTELVAFVERERNILKHRFGAERQA